MQHKISIPHIIGFILLAVMMLTSSCRKDFETSPSKGQLHFSTDTVYLDTTFTQISTGTYQLTVYNRSNHDISIPSIRLQQGQNSHYRLNVDGIPGKSFENIDILAEDSIFIFIETTVDIVEFGQNYNQFLYTDKILFDSGQDQQSVQLITLVKDAHFLYPEKFNNGTTETLTLGYDEAGNPIKISGFFLDDNELHFTDEKPYVIYGYAAVPSHKTLTIDAGARIYFHAKGGIIVANQASLHVNGLPSQTPAMENQVIFQGDRITPEFNERPGQWQTIWLTKGSTNNIINYATIKNATAGIKMDANDGSSSPTLRINNTKIFNCATVGLWITTGHVIGKNLAINNCGQAALYLALGGTYDFYNCTFVNYWNRSYRDFPAVLVSNKFETPESVFVADLDANFYNCILYGSQNYELLFAKSDEAAFHYKFENCLIKFNDYMGIYANDSLYDFQNTTHFESVFLNQDPVFLNPDKNKLQIDESSPANGIANPTTATLTDIEGNPRGNDPDVGAYESEAFPE